MSKAASWLIVGASGLLGHGLCRHLDAHGAAVTATRHSHPIRLPGIEEIAVDLTAQGTAASLLEGRDQEVVVYAAGLTNVDACERDEALALRLHATVPAALAAACRTRGQGFVFISTDHLWDGTKPVVEEDEPLHPLNAYARTKAAGEEAVRAALPDALIVRTNFFGMGRPWRKSLSDWMLDRLRAGETLNAFVDAHFSPIAVPLLSELLMDCVAAGLGGTHHVCGGEHISKYEFALRLADWCGLPRRLVRPCRLGEAGLVAPRPLDMSLSTEKISAALGRPMPNVDDSLWAVLGVPVMGSLRRIAHD